MDDLIKQLRQMYKKKLADKIVNIDSQWNLLLKERDCEQMKDFYKLIHMITGSAGSYGYPEIGEATHELEVYLKELIKGNELLSLNQEKEIEIKVDKVKKIINQTLYSNKD